MAPVERNTTNEDTGYIGRLTLRTTRIQAVAIAVAALLGGDAGNCVDATDVVPGSDTGGRQRDDTMLALLREDIYDRRWARRRDQLLTALAIVGVLLAVVLHTPALAAVVLSTTPRALKWRLRSEPAHPPGQTSAG